jgi:DNA repair exonuclease SbcCD ATPase subunit
VGSKGKKFKINTVLEKQCTNCKILQTVDNFYVDITKKCKFKSRCKKCQVVMRDKTKHNKGVLKSRLKILYNLSVDDFNNLMIQQGNCCKICGKHRDTQAKRLHVDHDHITGKVRGLLCSACNQALGLFKDDIAVLKSAIKYLNEANDANIFP